MFRAPTGAGLPSFELMLQDLPATPAQLARHLDISPRTLQRYQLEGQAPRAVMLAMFWETRWGRSAADTEAANWAALHFRRAEIAERQNVALRRQLVQLEEARRDGAANSPIWMTA
jgi:hypothetical protein